MRFNKREWKRRAWSFLLWQGHPGSKRLSRERRKCIQKLSRKMLKNFDLELLRNTAKKFVVIDEVQDLLPMPALDFNWKTLTEIKDGTTET